MLESIQQEKSQNKITNQSQSSFKIVIYRTQKEIYKVQILSIHL